MWYTKRRYLLSTLLLLVLTGCSSLEPREVRSWEEFIPGRNMNKEIVQEDNALEIKTLSNGKVFPDDCQWEALDRSVDGDTLLLESDMRVRFIGIDTPETKHPQKPVELFGPEASELTKDLLENSQEVCLIESEVGDDYDKYGRKLAYIFSEFGVDVNAELLRQGLAKGYFNFPFDREKEFRALEKQAQSERRNLWSKIK